MGLTLKALLARVRSVGRALWRADQLDADMQEEMRFHIDMEAERLIAQGLHPLEARRRAHVVFGGVEKYKEQGRDTRGLRWLDAVSLDCRFGIRMLVKHRGLTLVGGFAMAVAIAVGATFFETITEMLDPALPFPGGDRVVAVHYVTSNPGDPERRVLHEFAALRSELASVEHLGAFSNAQHNLVSANSPPEPIEVAEISATGFAIARTPPLLGRHLLPSDEEPASEPVIVIGHHAWRTRFGSDPYIVGRPVILGGVPHTVVGVMPEGFRFPVDHQFWIPFRENSLIYADAEGPALYMFGRLAPGITLQQAQAELNTRSQRTAANAAGQERRRPVVLPYTREHLDLSHPALVWMLRLAQVLVGALVFVVAVNLAILVYARTVTRLGEIAVRTALGASRRRILAQLFTEAFALSLVGAATGLVLADTALGVLESLVERNGGVPFWLDFNLSAGTFAYALSLAALAAIIMGVLPGLKATGTSVNINLHEFNGRTGTRLGATWTTLVIAQVAVAVAILPVAVFMSWQALRMELVGPGFAAEQIVVTTVTAREGTARLEAERLRARQRELLSRLEGESGVAAVTFSSAVPGFSGSRQIQFEDGVPLRETGTLWPSTLDVSIDTFDSYDVEILAGREFHAGDAGAARVVVVNEAFGRTYLENRSALGLRFRYVRSDPAGTGAQPEWYQIVGVVRDFPRFPPGLSMEGEPTVYHPAALGDLHPVVLSVRFAGAVPPDVINRVRQIGANVDPALQLRRVVPLSTFYGDVRAFWRYLAWGIGMITASVLLLSAAGIYALMSFTVAQRTREIGIRTALGAHPRRVLLAIFGRVMRQLTIGLMIGSAVSGVLLFVAGLDYERGGIILLIVVAIIAVVALVAAFGPARRGLSIQATEALRAS